MFLPKMHNQSNHEETTDKFKLRDIRQNNCTVLFKNVKVKKYKKGWGNVPDLKRLKKYDNQIQCIILAGGKGYKIDKTWTWIMNSVIVLN